MRKLSELLQGAVMDTFIFIFGKLVRLFLRVDTWMFAAFVVIALALAFHHYNLARRLSVLAVAIFLPLGVLPVGEWLLQRIEATYPANPTLDQVDGIILLGGSESTLSSAHWDQVQLADAGDRYLHTLALARRFPEARVVFAGGSGRLTDAFGIDAPEAALARKVFLDHGLDEARLTFESRSRNTAENARNAFDLVAPSTDQHWVLVTSAFHMTRAMRSFEAAGWQNVTAYPVDYYTAGPWDHVGWSPVEHIWVLNVAIKESVGQLAYRILGR